MIRGLYTAVSSMITQEAKQDVTTNNLANVNTVGFKGNSLAVKQFGDYMLSNFDKKVGNKNVRNDLGKLSYGSSIDEVSTDFTPGIIEQTNNPTDFAIDGKGFFVVRRNDGINQKDFYTRDGRFHVNSNGFLVNDSGDNVMGRNLSSNAVEPINVGKDSFTCDTEGNIVIGSNKTPTYKMQTVDFKANDNNPANDYLALEKVGDNLYTVSQNPQIPNTLVDNGSVVVRQSSIEKSNVNVINEMVSMMTNMRSFETSQKIVQTIDETLGKAVNEVGRV